MNNSAQTLLNTSVDDARSSLECKLLSDPGGAADDALQLLRYLEGMPNRATLRKIAATTLRKAVAQLEKAS